MILKYHDWGYPSETPYQSKLNEAKIDRSTLTKGKNKGDKVICNDFSYMSTVEEPNNDYVGSSDFPGQLPVMTVVKNGLKIPLKKKYNQVQYVHRDIIVEYKGKQYYACSKFFFLTK